MTEQSLVRQLDNLRIENEDLRAELEMLVDLVQEVAGAGVESINRKYAVVQVDIDTWQALQNLRGVRS